MYTGVSVSTSYVELFQEANISMLGRTLPRDISNMKTFFDDFGE